MATRRFGARPTEDLDNFAAVDAPDADNDTGEGYAVGSIWIDTALGLYYVCVDETEGAAVWRNITAAVLASVEEYDITNEAADRAYDADATTIDELCDVLGTLINDLIATGIVQTA